MMKEVTVVLPEATIGSDLQGCTLVDGWCTDTPTLHLEGTEPVAGQTITLIEGTRNGEPFGELGLVIQQDPDWLDQNGPPVGPQPQ